MLTHILIILVLALSQFGCSIEEGGGAYEPVPLTDQDRQELERLKQELVIEDIRVGSGPLAAWGRRIEADIKIRYANGGIVYDGPLHAYIGLQGSVFIHNADESRGTLSLTQEGIWLGLNGMAVGGKRRITIGPGRVYGGPLIKGALNQRGGFVHKESLVVEATLTASCVPVLLRGIKLPTSRYMIEREVWCGSSSEPQRSPSDPIWKLY
jgi:hypothetical protein